MLADVHPELFNLLVLLVNNSLELEKLFVKSDIYFHTLQVILLYDLGKQVLLPATQFLVDLQYLLFLSLESLL